MVTRRSIGERLKDLAGRLANVADDWGADDLGRPIDPDAVRAGIRELRLVAEEAERAVGTRSGRPAPPPPPPADQDPGVVFE